MLTTTAIDQLHETTATPDELEQELIHLEMLVSRIRARQVAIVRDADRMQLPLADGARSLKEWVAGRLDVHPSTASNVAYLARSQMRDDQFAAGHISFDRAAATARLADTGADAETIERSVGIAVNLVGRLAAQHSRMTASEEDEAFRRRRIWFQPNLDRTLMAGSVTLAGTDAELLLNALDERANELCDFRDVERPGLAQRRADALVSFATDQQYAPASHTPEVAPVVRRRKRTSSSTLHRLLGPTVKPAQRPVAA